MEPQEIVVKGIIGLFIVIIFIRELRKAVQEKKWIAESSYKKALKERLELEKLQRGD